MPSRSNSKGCFLINSNHKYWLECLPSSVFSSYNEYIWDYIKWPFNEYQNRERRTTPLLTSGLLQVTLLWSPFRPIATTNLTLNTCINTINIKPTNKSHDLKHWTHHLSWEYLSWEGIQWQWRLRSWLGWSQVWATTE